MLKTFQWLKELTPMARELDASISRGRTPSIVKNVTQIEGRVRTPRYVERIAGRDSDSDRKSRSEQFIEWVFASAIENRDALMKVRNFWIAVFDQALDQGLIICRNFWRIDEETECLLAARRSAMVAGDTDKVTDLTLRIIANEQEVLKMQAVQTVGHGFAVAGAASAGAGNGW
ncbi:MAG: hypothetical protein ABL984_06945 [Pyrinomonadaceae bacterium]